MSQFNDFDVMVSEMMAEFGFRATYKHIVTVPNDATGKVDKVITTTPVNCIRQELSRALNGQGTKPGTMIQEGDIILYVQPTEKADSSAFPLVVDQTADKIVIGSDTYSIVTVKLMSSSPFDNVAYEMYVRK